VRDEQSLVLTPSGPNGFSRQKFSSSLTSNFEIRHSRVGVSSSLEVRSAAQLCRRLARLEGRQPGSLHVIASEAKQSMSQRGDSWIASLRSQ
jgi:hypothetical protein